MTAREYLEQAYWLDKRIDSKLEQLTALKALATKSTSVMSQEVVSCSRNMHGLEETIAKIVDMEREINEDIDRLVDLKREIMQVVREVENPEYQMLLELHYLCLKPWTDVAERMGYTSRHIYRLHDEALEKIQIPQSCQRMSLEVNGTCMV